MLTILGTILIMLVSIGVGVVVDRRWSILPRRDRLLAGSRGLLGPGPGGTPMTALDVSAGALEMLRRARCASCKGDTDALADDHVAYDGRDLLVVHAKCRRCGLARSTYVFVG